MAEDEDANIISKMEKKKADPEKESLNNYSKYAVGGESKEVPASDGLDENDNFIHRRQQNQPKQKKNMKEDKDKDTSEQEQEGPAQDDESATQGESEQP